MELYYVESTGLPKIQERMVESSRRTIEEAIEIENHWKKRQGIASWYGESHRGLRTASGEPFNPDNFTCAYMGTSFGSHLTVCIRDSRNCVRVVVNDRGGFQKLGRLIDLSEASFEALAPLSRGLIEVDVWEEM